MLPVVGIVGCAKPVDAPTTKPPSAVTASVAEPSPEPACVVELGDAATLLGGTVSLRSIEGAPLTSGPQTAQFTGPGPELCGATLDKVSLLRFPHDGSRTVEAVHAQFVEELEGHGLQIGDAEERVADPDLRHVAYTDPAATPPTLLYVAATRLPEIDALFVVVYTASGAELEPIKTAIQRSALTLSPS